MDRAVLQSMKQKAEADLKSLTEQNGLASAKFSASVQKNGTEAQAKLDALDAYKGEKKALEASGKDSSKEDYDEMLKDISAREAEEKAAAEKFAITANAENEVLREALNKLREEIRTVEGEIRFYEKAISRLPAAPALAASS